jgi:hypothetical protein
MPFPTPVPFPPPPFLPPPPFPPPPPFKCRRDVESFPPLPVGQVHRGPSGFSRGQQMNFTC